MFLSIGKILRRTRPAIFAVLGALAAAGCSEPVNAPRPLSEYGTNTLFSTFSGRSPKTLDPQVSYSSDETIYTYGIYEPLYGYEYLKRPYTLMPLGAQSLVRPQYRDKNGNVLAPDAKGSEVAYSVYTIPIRKGALFAPHPAFAKDKDGRPLALTLSPERAEKLASPLDLPERGTRELTAYDYVYGIKRIASPAVVSPAFGILRSYIVGFDKLASDIAAALEKQKAEGKAGERLDLTAFDVEFLRAADDHTLEITIRGKYPQFDNWLAMAFFAPVPWEAEAFYANPGFAGNNISLAAWPVGTGPYMLAVSRQNREHILERNPNYHGLLYPCEGTEEDRKAGYLADCGKPTPFVDRIVMTMEKEAVPVTSKFLQGYYDSPQITRLDVGQGYIVAMGDDPDKEKLYKEKNLQFPTTVEANLWYVGFNWLDPVVGEGKTPEEKRRNRLLRQAISIALDWEEQIAIFEKGQGTTAHGPLPPGLFGWRDDGPSAFNPVVFEKDAEGKVRRRSIEEAKRLMAEAGYPDGRDASTGRSLVLNFDWQGTSAGSKSFLDWTARQFAKIGIQLEIRATDYNRFQDKMAKGSAQIYYWGWLADYPDAENFLTLLYGPNSKALNGAGENASNYRNARFDRLFESLRNLENGPEKARVIDEMIGIVQQDAPWSFGYFPTSAAALHHWVKNAKPTQMIRNNVQYIRIDAKERASQIRAWNTPVVWPLVLILAAAGLVVWFVRAHLKRMRAQKGLGSEA